MDRAKGKLWDWSLTEEIPREQEQEKQVLGRVDSLVKHLWFTMVNHFCLPHSAHFTHTHEDLLVGNRSQWIQGFKSWLRSGVGFEEKLISQQKKQKASGRLCLPFPFFSSA